MYVIYTTNNRLCLSMNEQWYSGWGESRTGERKDQVYTYTHTHTHARKKEPNGMAWVQGYTSSYITYKSQEGFRNYAV